MTSTNEALLSRLQRIADTTAAAEKLAPPSWWVGDAASERQVKDDISAGRFYFQTAHNNALAGIAALESGDDERAELHAWEAYHFLVTALLSRLRPSDLAVLQKPAGKRGRPAKN